MPIELSNVAVIVKREYLQRIKTKGFWIATLILPLFAAALTIIPGLLIAKTRTRQHIVVVDETGRVGAPLVAEAKRAEAALKDMSSNKLTREQPKLAQFDFELAVPELNRKAQREKLDQRVSDKDIGAWVWISPGVLSGDRVEYHARNVSNLFTQDELEDLLTNVVRQARLKDAGIDPERVKELTQQVRLDTQRVAAGASRAQGGIGGMMFAVVLFLILYIAILMWGQQVMVGVLEEKGSRVIEVVLSAIRPFELMMGKLVGICLVGMTQLAIWLGTIILVTAPGIAASLAFLPEGTTLPTLSPVMALHFGLLFILGFFSFATIYAAIGSAFNNLQEAQQAASVAVIFVIFPTFVMYPIINDPSSTMAVVLSLIPLFTPLLMPLRIAIEMPPAWQLGLAYALSLGFVWLMVFLCARVYRVGILMYGKKPTFQEIWRWLRYA